MLAPNDIRRQAQLRYADFLRSIVRGKTFFPLPIRFGRPSPTEDFNKLRSEINALTDADLGCNIEWTEVNSHRWGKQRFPQRLDFGDETSYVRAIGKTKEVARFRENLAITRERCPVLVAYLETRPSDAVEFADDWGGLLEVCCYLQLHSRPNLYARELPLSVDTKFVERHQSVLARLLSVALPASVIMESERFEERFGLRYEQPQIRFRLLDESLLATLGVPFRDVAIPAEEFQNLNWNRLRVVVSENKMTFLTLPCVPRTIGVWGAGNAAALLHSVSWLAECNLFYWGDVDAQGFEILARLREAFPRTKSIMMDAETITRFRDLCVAGVESSAKIRPQLTSTEEKAHQLVRASNLRLEQERIPIRFAAITIETALMPQDKSIEV